MAIHMAYRTLFSLYMNDLPEVIVLISNLESYVDGTKICFSLRQKTLIYVYAKVLRISNMLQRGVAPATF